MAAPLRAGAMSRAGHARPLPHPDRRAVRPALAERTPDAHLDPWCVARGRHGWRILFGFALRHPSTGGLSWMASTELVRMDLEASLCGTRSGRVYLLGRRFRPEEVALEGEEAALAFAILVEEDRASGSQSAPTRLDRLWLSSCKTARHLGVAPPGRDRREIIGFMNRHLAEYGAAMARRSCR